MPFIKKSMLIYSWEKLFVPMEKASAGHSRT